MTLPIIRLEIEGMRYQVVHALAQHDREMEEAVSRGVDEAIKQFDFSGEVRRQAERLIQEHVQRAVSFALSEIFSGRDVQSAVRQSVEAALSGMKAVRGSE